MKHDSSYSDHVIAIKTGFAIAPIALAGGTHLPVMYFRLPSYPLSDKLTSLPVPIDLDFNKPDDKEPLINEAIGAVHY